MTAVAFLPADHFVGFALADVLDAAQRDELIGVLPSPCRRPGRGRRAPRMAW